jgi:SAM-dependent methyltransferase
MVKKNQGTLHYDNQFFNDIEAGALDSARAVVPVVVNLVQPENVVDFGCGRGAWLKAFRENGIETLLGMDGNYVDREKLLIEAHEFSCADLTTPIKLDRRFDLAICLEVAEHLPAKSSRTLVASLVDAAPVVLFSAAIPGQGGTHHVNEQWPEYWEQIFATFGYRKVDSIRPLIWRDAQIAWWYRQNVYLYATDGLLQTIRERAGCDGLGFPPGLDIISASIFNKYKTFRGLLRETLRAGLRRLKS